ncbi:Ionotropic receptor 75a, partial [Diabrotica virgifera virgifera]
DQFKLLKELSTRYVACQFETFNSNLTFSVPPEHQLFLLDTACNGSEKLLEK